jgi:CDP-glucose 4,6-dehydratase
MTDPMLASYRTVFVTGASGIVGSWLTKQLLRQSARVVVLQRDLDPQSELARSGELDQVVCVRGNLEDLALLERILVEYEVEVVFHLGAQTQVRHAQRQPLATLEANVRGTYNLLEAVRRTSTSVRALVVASSDKAYGQSDNLPYREDHPLSGRNIYDASKSAADLLATAYASSYSLPIGIARCGNIYGGGDLNWDRIVPGTIRALLRGERPVLRSDGSPRRDYIFVDDVVSAYMAIASALVDGREHGEAFNFGQGEPVAVLELVNEIGRVIGSSDVNPIIESNAPNEIPAQWLDSSKARDRLGWQPAYPLAEGLFQTVDWYRRLFS